MSLAGMMLITADLCGMSTIYSYAVSTSLLVNENHLTTIVGLKEEL
jgi:hypothetical protein